MQLDFACWITVCSIILMKFRFNQPQARNSIISQYPLSVFYCNSLCVALITICLLYLIVSYLHLFQVNNDEASLLLQPEAGRVTDSDDELLI